MVLQFGPQWFQTWTGSISRWFRVKSYVSPQAVTARPALTTYTKRRMCCPGNKHLNRSLSPGLMKNNLDTQLQQQFQSGELASCAEKWSSIKKYKSCIRALHTICVAQTVAGYEHNKVLNTTAPEIDSSEIELPRKASTLLAQLRSGYCAWLNSYKHRLNPKVHDFCLDCNSTPHSVAYPFACPMHQTDLTPVYHWLQPKQVAKFLNA